LLPTVAAVDPGLHLAFKPHRHRPTSGRFPKERGQALDEEARHLKGEASAATDKATNTVVSPRDALAPSDPPQGAPKS
jgi:hypothetical protein